MINITNAYIQLHSIYHILIFFFFSVPLKTGSTNLVGKFTQSVRRIVQDVKDEGPASGMTRDEVIDTNERLRAVRIRLEESYDTAKKSLVTLMNKYGDSKTHKNIFNRYPLLKIMIKVILFVFIFFRCS